MNKDLLKTLKNNLVREMKTKIGRDKGRAVYRAGYCGACLCTSHSQYWPETFQLTGQEKGQCPWQPMALLHNALKLHRYGEMT